MAKQNIPSKSLSVITGLALGSTIYVLATSTRADDSGVIGPVPAEDTDLTEDRMALEALDITGEKKSADAGVQDAGDVSAVPIPATETPDGGPAAPEDKKTHDDLSLFGIEKRGLAHKPTESIQQGKGWQGAARLFADYRILENLLTGVRQEGPSLNGEAGLGRDWGLGGAGLRLGYGQSRVTVEKARAELGESTQHTLYYGPMGYLEIAHGKDLETQLYAALQGLLKESKSQKPGLRPRTTEISNDGLEAELSVALPCSAAYNCVSRSLPCAISKYPIGPKYNVCCVDSPSSALAFSTVTLDWPYPNLSPAPPSPQSLPKPASPFSEGPSCLTPVNKFSNIL